MTLGTGLFSLKSKKPVLLSLLTAAAGSNVLVDNADRLPPGIALRDYCPYAPGCADGTHVLCLHSQKTIGAYGSACRNVQNTTMSNELAVKLLGLINAMRSQVARGLMKGMKGTLLPKGYGMKKIQWDYELATFAQIWANQCLYKKDLCRSTKRFSDVGQTVSQYLVSFPWWGQSYATREFHPGSLLKAVALFAAYWYRGRRLVTADMIANGVANFTSQQEAFLQLVSGRLSHVGCGVAVFDSHDGTNALSEVLYHQIFFVCNFSHAIRRLEPVYPIIPKKPDKPDDPKDPDKPDQCGCPPGTVEDPLTCLCSRVTSPTPCSAGVCKPNVVLLPIFAVEDKLPQTRRSRKMNTRSKNREYPRAMEDDPDEPEIEVLSGEIKPANAPAPDSSFQKLLEQNNYIKNEEIYSSTINYNYRRRLHNPKVNNKHSSILNKTLASTPLLPKTHNLFSLLQNIEEKLKHAKDENEIKSLFDTNITPMHNNKDIEFYKNKLFTNENSVLNSQKKTIGSQIRFDTRRNKKYYQSLLNNITARFNQLENDLLRKAPKKKQYMQPLNVLSKNEEIDYDQSWDYIG